MIDTIDALLANLEAAPFAHYLRFSRWSYAVVNALHILGIAVVVGSALPIGLRLLGLWRVVPVASLTQPLARLAAFGLLLAVSSGFLLFSIRARDYAGLGVFQIKLALIVVAALSPAILHATHGLTLDTASPTRRAVHGALSITCWIAALFCGRLIAFMGD